MNTWTCPHRSRRAHTEQYTPHRTRYAHTQQDMQSGPATLRPPRGTRDHEVVTCAVTDGREKERGK
eukprot:2969648-Rhodomonas_salina.1